MHAHIGGLEVAMGKPSGVELIECQSDLLDVIESFGWRAGVIARVAACPVRGQALPAVARHDHKGTLAGHLRLDDWREAGIFQPGYDLGGVRDGGQYLTLGSECGMEDLDREGMRRCGGGGAVDAPNGADAQLALELIGEKRLSKEPERFRGSRHVLHLSSLPASLPAALQV